MWNLRIIFSRTTEPIPSIPGIKHLWERGIYVYWNDGQATFLKGDNNKVHGRNRKLFFSGTAGPIQSSFAKSIHGEMELKFVQVKVVSFFPKGDNKEF